MTPLADAACREVETLHGFFVELFTGRTRDIGRAAAAFAPDFEMVTPDGARLGRAAVLAALAAARAGADFSISISAMRVLREDSNSVLLQYVEQQYRDGKTTRRLSAALFEAKPEAPSGVVWRYLHETWMRDAG